MARSVAVSSSHWATIEQILERDEWVERVGCTRGLFSGWTYFHHDKGTLSVSLD